MLLPNKILYLMLFTLAWFSQMVNATPQVMLIMDDIGYRHTDKAALALPTEVTFSILPATPHSKDMAYAAHAQGRDIMLHLPMEAMSGRRLGPQALQVGMFPSAISETFASAIDSVPFAVGVNNHMGSRLTKEVAPMLALMQEIKARNLFFVDSRTTADSVAEQVALRVGLPVASRNVFIDHTQTQESMQRAFERLVKLAKRRGFAIGIAHPHPQTVRFLLQSLPLLEQYNVKLVSARQYFMPSTRLMAVKPSLTSPSAAPQ